MFNCAPHFDYKTTFTPRLNQAYLVDFQSYYVRICSFECDPFCGFKKGSRVGNPIGVQTRTFSESKEQKKVCKSTTYTLFEQLRTVLSGERGIRTPGPVTVNGFQDRRNRPLCHLSGCKIIAYPPNFKINYCPPQNHSPYWILYIQKGTPKSAFLLHSNDLQLFFRIQYRLYVIRRIHQLFTKLL